MLIYTPRVLYIALLLPFLALAREETTNKEQITVTDDTHTVTSKCRHAIHQLTSAGTTLLQDDFHLVLHRNGEPEPCGIASPVSLTAIEEALQALWICQQEEFNKHEIESFLTVLFHNLLEKSECGSPDNATAPEGIYGHCDMGPLRTTIQPDHDRLVETPEGSLPCRFYTREGARISTFEYLSQLADEARASFDACAQDDKEKTCASGPTVHLYAVPAGRMFMLAPSYVGEKFYLTHVTDVDETKDKIVIETISVNPRVFEIHDFFSPEEADTLIGKSKTETSATHKLHRSTTGATEGTIFSKRTSENAWDTHGKTALEVKRRCLSMLGMDEYWESHTDGLQILRYQNLQAYTTHPDYLDIKTTENYNYNSSNVGGNRFATVLLYMSDHEDDAGGETLFEYGWPIDVPESERKTKEEALRELRASPEGALLKKNSWEEEMTALCRSRLAFKPARGRAALFYSQYPNGTEDKSVSHGGCPVLKGTKWAANLWVWNGPRAEFDGAPLLRPKEEADNPSQLHATFTNTGKDPRFDKAELFYDEAGHFGSLGSGETVAVNTFEGHVWNIKAGDELLKTIVINDEKKQVYEL